MQKQLALEEKELRQPAPYMAEAGASTAQSFGPVPRPQPAFAEPQIEYYPPPDVQPIPAGTPLPEVKPQEEKAKSDSISSAARKECKVEKKREVKKVDDGSCGCWIV